MSGFAMIDGISVTENPYLHSDKTQKTKYAAFEQNFAEDSRKSLAEMIVKCTNLKTITVHGYAMCGDLVGLDPLHSPYMERLLKKLDR